MCDRWSRRPSGGGSLLESIDVQLWILQLLKDIWEASVHLEISRSLLLPTLGNCSCVLHKEVHGLLLVSINSGHQLLADIMHPPLAHHKHERECDVELILLALVGFATRLLS